MSLRALLDSTAAGTGQTVDPIPCLTQDADLWFSDSPSEVEEAKRLCRDCPVRHGVSPTPWSVTKQRGCGAASCS